MKTDSKTAIEPRNPLEKLNRLRKILNSFRRTEETGFDTYWITVDALDMFLDELEQAIAATLGAGECAECAVKMVEHADSLCDPLKGRMNDELMNDRVARLLGESGADYTVSSHIRTGTMYAYDKFTVYDEAKMPVAQIEVDASNREAVLLTLRCTPEQAIDATLGETRTRDDIEADIDCYRAEDCPDYLRVPVYRVRSWLDRQAAITRQEIEAEMGAGECEVEYVSEWMGWHCKSCDTLWQGLPDQKPSFCMRCGKAVKS